jgi:hypothetical protein
MEKRGFFVVQRAEGFEHGEGFRVKNKLENLFHIIQALVEAVGFLK